MKPIIPNTTTAASSVKQTSATIKTNSGGKGATKVTFQKPGQSPTASVQAHTPVMGTYNINQQTKGELIRAIT